MSSLVLTADTLLGTPTVGSLEYDGKSLYTTPQGTQRGIVPGAQFYRLDSAYAGANATGAQGVFGVGTGGTGIGVTLSASTVYAFDYYAVFSKSAGVTSHTFSLGFGGSATLNNILYGGATNNQNSAYTAGNVSGATNFDSNTAASTVFIGASTSAGKTNYLYAKGTVSINAGGTFIPQYTLSAAPGGAYSTLAGSYFYIYPIGASGAAINVGTWS